MEGLREFFTHVSVDLIVIAITACIAAFDGFRNGIGRAVTAALSFPPALLLYSLLPKTAFVGSYMAGSGLISVIVFIVLFALIYFALRRMGLEYVGIGMGGPIQALLGALGIAITLILILVLVPAFETYISLSTYIKTLFAEQYRVFWLMGTYVLLAIAGR